MIKGWPDYDEVKSPSDILPEGEYRFRIERAEEKETKGTGKLGKCRMLALRLALPDGHKCYDNIVLHNSLFWRLESLSDCIGEDITVPPASEIDGWEYLEGSTGRATICHNVYNGARRLKVKKYIKGGGV